LRRFLIFVVATFGVVFVLLVIVASVVSPPERNSKETQKKADSKTESETGEPVPAVIRISGEPGTPYRCTYSSYAIEEGERDPVRYESEDQGTLSALPVEYASQAIDHRHHGLDFIHANCRITNAGPTTAAQGSLRA